MLLYLSHRDFYLDGQQTLATLVKGLSLVLFYSANCQYSQQILPQFQILCRHLTGCQFGLVNVNQNMALVQKSRGTSTVIDYVPMVILYINGVPKIKYEGACDPASVRQFLDEVSRQAQQSTFFHPQRDKTHHATAQVRKYSLGSPLFGDDEVTYIEVAVDPREYFHGRQ